jgi:hypothetical protein
MNYIYLLFCLIWFRLNFRFFFKKDNPREEKFKDRNDQIVSFYSYLTIIIFWMVGMFLMFFDLPNFPLIKFFMGLIIFFQLIQALKLLATVIVDNKMVYTIKTPKDVLQHTFENVLILYLIYYYAIIKLNLFSF